VTERTDIAKIRTAQPFHLPPPQPLTLLGVRDDLARQSSERAASVKGYLVHADLDHQHTAERGAELAEQLAGYHPAISPNTDGRTKMQLTVTGHDMWQAVLAAMVALTNADCAPTTMNIAQSKT
jgi:hypothetical protein